MSKLDDWRSQREPFCYADCMNVFRFRQFDIIQEHAAMKVGTDSDLLGTLGAGGQHILDIGTGTGVLSLMYAQRYPDARITAVEIDDDAVLDARANFANSRFAERITLHHIAFQDYLVQCVERYDSIICNPPYFDKSLECPDLGRLRARHSSSLPFDVLAKGAYDLLEEGGTFSVCIPPEVLDTFDTACLFAGFASRDRFQIQSLPQKPPKRYVLVYQKGGSTTSHTHTYCMRNADHSRSEWYTNQMKDFLVPGGKR